MKTMQQIDTQALVSGGEISLEGSIELPLLKPFAQFDKESSTCPAALLVGST
jgi:hypothetical protein